METMTEQFVKMGEKQSAITDEIKGMSKVMEEGMKNMKISTQGSIRRAPNVIQNLYMASKLVSFGLPHFNEFIKEWNKRSAPSHRIVGKRALTLKLLFESAPEACNEFSLKCSKVSFVLGSDHGHMLNCSEKGLVSNMV